MPEGPEVMRVQKGLEILQTRLIIKATVTGGRYIRKPIDDLERLEGSEITHTSVKGKLIIFHLSEFVGFNQRNFAALSTLGMTGWWEPYYLTDPKLEKYKRISLILDDDSELAYFDPRNFGTFKVVSTDEMKRKREELGPDVMTHQRTHADVEIPKFIERVRRFGKKTTLAEGLLDQRIACGVGNYIRADAMYLMRFSPLRRMSELTDQQLRFVWTALHWTAKCAWEDTYPEVRAGVPDELKNGGYRNLVYGQQKSPTGGTIQNYSDKHGRTVWYSAQEQS